MNLPVPVALNRLAAALRVLSLGMGLAARGISDNHRTLPSLKPINSSPVMLNPVAADVSMTPPFGWLKQRVVVPLALVSAIACSCRAQEASREPAPTAVVTHRAVPLPPKANAALLWVALDDHLGRGTTTERSGPLLTLNSAGQQSLRLIDGVGTVVAEERSLRLSWRLARLAAPVEIARQMAGPYASFESAERIASLWRDQGVVARVAHPRDWEVWAPIDAERLDGVPVRTWLRTLKTEMKIVLEGPLGGRTLQGPLMLQAPSGLLWQGGVLRGPFRLQPDAYGSWTLLEQVPIERYLEGVVPHEIGAGSPTAALEAQAVLARTWALANSHRFAIDGYHLCSDTQCQVYSDPRQASAAVRQAIRATAGQVLAWNGEPIQAWYHASNGGGDGWRRRGLGDGIAPLCAGPCRWFSGMDQGNGVAAAGRLFCAWLASARRWCQWHESPSFSLVAHVQRCPIGPGFTCFWLVCWCPQFLKSAEEGIEWKGAGPRHRDGRLTGRRSCCDWMASGALCVACPAPCL